MRQGYRRGNGDESEGGCAHEAGWYRRRRVSSAAVRSTRASTVPPMRYLVTGSAGFIGSHLTEALKAEGHEVVGLDCFTDYYDVALKEENARGQEILRLDLARDPIDLTGFDGVFHLAGQPGVRSFGDVFETYLERNVLASQRVFEAAARDGVRVVFASSSSIYGDAEAYPTSESVPAAAGVAVRDHEAHL